MGQTVVTPKQVIAALKKSKPQWTLNGNRIAILRDAAEDTFGSGLLVRPEQYKGQPLEGTIISVGDEVPADKNLKVGKKVQFNKYNVLGFAFKFDDFDDVVTIDVIHVPDIYWRET